ncbi:tripartite tricarboxylate transporter permease [Mycetocola reblochoni]|uniref:Tricarboxylate transport membrane protein TctA n=2 Tax=Mycetocola reblochoni TaxID=331618 RepID=A0A1R4KA23_9MICO|nr:tripartite tricarboxylate transporter permease [Mycetocola reblochoni]RLP71166.1 tripartite tricarboxylate transporter permease [Mycetocola reblochoni]SJN41014.1 Tricarboxylate transport membrane protein TctA [Mycetocola reblochoni REB411]
MIDNLVLGFQNAFTPENLLWCFIGVLLGTIIGILPGLGSSTGVAILIPVTLAFDPLTALIMLAGIYHGSQFGATITAILIATPGEASSVVSTLDGYQMARKGRAGPALAISALGSFTAAMISLVALMAVAPVFASVALTFGPPEMLAVMILGLSTIVVFASRNVLIGVAMGLGGLLLATVGVDVGSGTARFAFGQVELYSGIPFVEVMIGLFALGELLNQLHQGAVKPIRARFRDLILTKEDLRRSVPSTLRGTLIGFVVGILPGAGSTLASFMAYGAEKKFSKNRDQLGTGAIEGVVAPDAATNSSANMNFVPTLTLGVPGGATTAVLLGAFLMYGIQPGPLLFENQPGLVWGLLVSFFIGNVILLVLNLPMAPVFAQVLRVPYSYLYPLIIFTSIVGAYTVANNSFSVWIVLIFGVIGYAMKRLNLPMAPLVLGLVIGPLLEKSLVQTSALGDGNIGIVFESPIALVILGLAVLMVFGGRFQKKLTQSVMGGRKGGKGGTRNGSAFVTETSSVEAVGELADEIRADERAAAAAARDSRPDRRGDGPSGRGGGTPPPDGD